MTVVDDQDFTLHHGDLLGVLPTLPAQSFDAVVTSPPYLDARDDVVSCAVTHYADWAYEWLAAIRRTLYPSGSLMLNLGRIHRGGEELEWHHEIIGRARRSGWFWIDTLVWHKVNGGGGRSSPYLIDRHEYIYWLAPSTSPYKGFDEARVPYSPATLGRYTRRYERGHAVKGSDRPTKQGRTPHPDGAKAGSVFVSSVGADKGIDHPTPMAPELAEHLIKLACIPGGVVLDPFAGSGTTARAARKLGRRCVGIEIDEAHCAEAARLSVQQALPFPA